MRGLSRLQKCTAIFAATVTLVCITAGVIVRSSYNDDIQQIANNPDTVLWYCAEPKLSVNNYDLLWEADIIVRASANDMGIVSMQSTRVHLTVKDAYKGNLAPGDSFYFWVEPVFAYDVLDGKPMFCARSLTNLIQPGKEYIVFANEQHTNEKYKKHADIPSYMPANYPLIDPLNFSAVSYFDTESERSVILDKQELDANKVKYADVRNNEIYCYSREAADEYYELKRKVFERLNISTDGS